MNKSLNHLGRTISGKILLVEDDIEFGAWLEDNLKSIGLTCHWEKDLQGALKSLEMGLFHAVITDIFLKPGVPEGLDVIKAVQTSGTPIIMMSSQADLKIAKESVNFGVSYILEKPFQINELIRTLIQLWEEPKGLQAMLERFMDLNQLTPKEKEVTRLVVKGLANKEIAEVEDITDRTIKAHLTSIFQKCGVTSRTELFNAIFPT